MSFGEEDPDDGLSFTERIEEYKKLKDETKDKHERGEEMKSEEEIEVIKQHRIDILKPVICATKEELVSALSKKRGVTLFEIPKCNNVGFIKGEATILVIRK
jgi:hypothetical protein